MWMRWDTPIEKKNPFFILFFSRPTKSKRGTGKVLVPLILKNGHVFRRYFTVVYIVTQSQSHTPPPPNFNSRPASNATNSVIWVFFSWTTVFRIFLNLLFGTCFLNLLFGTGFLNLLFGTGFLNLLFGTGFSTFSLVQVQKCVGFVPGDSCGPFLSSPFR